MSKLLLAFLVSMILVYAHVGVYGADECKKISRKDFTSTSQFFDLRPTLAKSTKLSVTDDEFEYGWAQGCFVFSRLKINAAEAKTLILGIGIDNSVRLIINPGNYKIDAKKYRYAYMLKKVSGTYGKNLEYQVKEISLLPVFYELFIDTVKDGRG